MKITYICPNHTMEIKGETLYSPLASERYRIINPSEALHKRGHEINMNFEPVKGSKVDVVFVGKFLTSPKPWLKSIQEYKDAGAKIVFDVCDNYVDAYKKSPEFTTLLELTDKFTCPSNMMSEVLEAHFKGKPIHYIPDAPELQYHECHVLAYNYLWFGQAKNLECFAKAKFPENATLQLVTNLSTDIVHKFKLDVNVSLTQWSLERLQKALNAGQYVCIPANVDDPWYQTKSANRALEALWAGCPVMASRIPEYEHIGLPGIYLMDDFDYEKPIAAWENTFDDVSESQDIINDVYMIDRTVLEWEKAFV